MKKIILLALFAILFVHVGEAFAQQEFVPLAPIPNLTGEGDVTTSEGLPDFFNNLYTYLIGIAAVLAIFQIIRVGIGLAMNTGNVSEIMALKGTVAQAILGLVLVLTPALVFGIINPNILNLSVSLPPIDFEPEEVSYSGQTTSLGGECSRVTGPVEGTFWIKCVTEKSWEDSENKLRAFLDIQCASLRKSAPFRLDRAKVRETVTENGQISTIYSHPVQAWCSKEFSATGIYLVENVSYSHGGGRTDSRIIGIMDSEGKISNERNLCGSWALNDSRTSGQQASGAGFVSCPGNNENYQQFILGVRKNSTEYFQCLTQTFYCQGTL